VRRAWHSSSAGEPSAVLLTFDRAAQEQTKVLQSPLWVTLRRRQTPVGHTHTEAGRRTAAVSDIVKHERPMRLLVP